MYPEERASLGLSVGAGVVALDNSRRVCPVCKSMCSVPTLVPIYVRSSIHEQQLSSEVQNADNEQQERQTQERNQADDGIGNRVHATTPSESRTTGNTEQSLISLPEDGRQEFAVPASTGLRQRRTAQSEQPDGAQEMSVPNRPAASSPHHVTSSNRNQHGPSHINNVGNRNDWINPMSPNGRPHGSLTHGILMSFQQASAMHASNSTNESGDLQQQQRAIPSLHNIRDGSFDNSHQYSHNNNHIDVNSETTQYLSRLLIMLTSFVVLCLLLF
jgi:hypothetical protein